LNVINEQGKKGHLGNRGRNDQGVGDKKQSRIGWCCDERGCEQDREKTKRTSYKRSWGEEHA